jgi:hypothetical protein
MWKCLNPECGRKFPMLGRKTIEKRPPPSFSPDVPVRVMVEIPICPYCESIEFEEVKT